MLKETGSPQYSTKEEGAMVQVVQGEHRGILGGDVITIRHENGATTEFPFESDTKMEPFMVEPLIDSCGLLESWDAQQAGKARAAATDYLTKLLSEERENGYDAEKVEYTLHVEAFLKGYEACLRAR